jgi:hypothetical protein
MGLFSEFEQRRAANAKKVAAFGVATTVISGGSMKVIRNGAPITIYTVGYERRDVDDLMSAVRDQGVRAIADIRERPVSRKPAFRASALRAVCEAGGIEYQAWPMLGSAAEQREGAARIWELPKLRRPVSPTRSPDDGSRHCTAGRKLAADCDRIALL